MARSQRRAGGVVLVAAILAVVLVAVGVVVVRAVHDEGGTSSGPTAARGHQDSRAAPTEVAPGRPGVLLDSHSCPEMHGFTCSTLRVPLDHARPGGRALGLQVAVGDNSDALRGVLLLLTGGPGQPGVSLLPRILRPYENLRDEFRFVVIDQRGTGEHPLHCPGLQLALGASDLFRPSDAAIEACAAAIGPDWRFYGTADTVADLDLLRQAIGVPRWSLDGVSYGTFTAEHYAIAHPDRVARMVLDSVVPHQGIEPFLDVPLRAAGRLLHQLCQRRSCPADPSADLHTVVTRRTDGTDILNALTIEGFVSTTYAGVPELLHAAAGGDPSGLDALVAGVREGVQRPDTELSQGLHAATLCADIAWPWGPMSTPVRARAARLRATVSSLPAARFLPFDVRTAATNGILATCARWPAGRTTPLPRPGSLPDVPTLLMAGQLDLSTPVEWLRAEAAVTPDATVFVVPGATHAVQGRAADPEVMRMVERFLRGQAGRRG